MKKLLSLLGSVAVIGGSSATIVACGTKPKAIPKENPIEVAKTKLKNLIEEANGLVSASRKEEAVTKALQDAINKAQEILDKEAVTESELTDETVVLQEAIDEFKRAEDANLIAARKALQAKITEAQQLVDTSKKEEAVTNALRTAIKEAQSVLATQATEQDYTKATTKLTEAIDIFKSAEDASLIAARKALQAKITEAQQLVDTSKKEASVTETLKNAVNKAQEILAKEAVTESELKNEVATLQEAIDKFNRAEDASLIAARKALQAKIAEAQQLVDTSKKEETVTNALKSAITKAQQALKEESATEVSLNAATTKLTKAIDAFKNAEDVSLIAARKALQAKIAEAQKLVDTSEKEGAVTNELQSSINEAQKVLNEPKSNEANYKAATDKLSTAIKKFNEAKNAIDIAREALQAEIAKAEALLENSKKEPSVNESLKTAIDSARQVLDDEKSTEKSFRDAKDELTKAIAKFNEARDLDQQLLDKIQETKNNKAEVEKKNNQNGWEGISAKSQRDFEAVIKQAETVAQKNNLTKEEVAEQIEKLDEAIKSFKLTLPQTIVSQAINLREDNIKNLIFKDWSYKSFFDAQAQQKDKNARLVNILTNDVSELASKNGYTATEQAKLSEPIVNYFAEQVELVYLNDQDGKQKIKSIINDVNKDATLEQIFHSYVKKEFPEANLNDPEFWKNHPQLSLGIKFSTENLNPETKEFWSFNLIGDISKEDQEDFQRLFKEAEKRDGGRIILEIRKGLDGPDGTFVSAANEALLKKVFYGRRFLRDLNAIWYQLPNRTQMKEGVIGWKSSESMRLRIAIPFSPRITLFDVLTAVIMNVR